MNWIKLASIAQLDEIIEASHNQPKLLFKHSTRCSISSMALNRLVRSWDENETSQLAPHYLDLIAHRDVSNAISDKLDIQHQSPQLLIVSDGKVIYDASHMEINYSEVIKVLNGLATA